MKRIRRRLSLFALALAAFTLAAPVFATDVSITSTAVVPSTAAVVRTWTAGAAITAGKLVYFSATDFKLYLADCDSATAAVRDCYGIALTSSAAGAPCTVCLEDPALTLGGTTANGTVYCLSATAGGVAPLADITTGGYVTVIGVGSTTSVIAFRAKGIRSTVALP